MVFEFLDCGRWADAEGEGYKALPGGNRLQADGKIERITAAPSTDY
jgi:hypothetical protein